MASKWLAVCCASLVLSSIAACGDDDDGGGASLPGSVSRDEQLEDLDEDQVVDLCETLDDQLSDVVSERDAIRLSCILTAYTSSLGGAGELDEEACEDAVEECVDEGGIGEPTTTSECDADELVSSAEGCELTAGELVDCLNANARQVAAAVDAINCSTLADDPDAIDDAFGAVAECRELERECPEVLDVDSEEPAGGGEDPTGSRCEDTCGSDDNGEWAGDGTCDDGGPDSENGACTLGTDCMDCGER
jgi:hypothetical protein